MTSTVNENATQDALPAEALQLIAQRFRVLGDPTRLRILNVLMQGEHTVSELVEGTGFQQANVSKHLSLLRSSGFVTRRKEGVRAHYGLADDSVFTLCEIMCGRLEARADAHLSLLSDRGSSDAP